MRPLKVPVAVPQWLRALPADSLLNVRDVTAIFGFRSIHVVATYASQGRFPRPEYHLGTMHRAEWKAITIRNEIRRRAKLNAERKAP